MPLLRLSPKVVFCAVVDRNGVLSTSGVQLSKQDAGAPVPRPREGRDRGILDDPIGLAAARSERKFLLQTYYGVSIDGVRVLMKDLSVPVRVDGRHWGCLRLGYRA